MAINPQEPTHFERLPTPNVAQVSVLLWVEQSRILNSTVITPGTTVNNFIPGIDKGGVLAGQYGSYVLSTIPVRKRDDGYLGYTFVKPNATSAYLKDLTPFKTVVKWLPITWEPVLRKLYAMTGTSVDGTDINSTGAGSYERSRPMTVDRYELINGLPNHPTEVTVREYLSASPILGVRVERQQPTRISYNYGAGYNALRNTIDCLHDDVTVPELLENGVLVQDFGTPNAQETNTDRGQFFPATVPMKSWRTHIYDADMQLTESGVYHLITYTAKPPPMPQAQEL